jgi:DNA modification methylase
MEEAFFQVAHLPQDHRIPHIYKGDARRIAAEDKQFDLVITSPPYGDLRSTIPYDQFSRHMLYWLGFDESVLTEIRRGSLGARDKQKNAPESETLKQALKGIQRPHSIEKAICFYRDYYDALKEIVRVTSGRIIIVIGHRVLNDVLINSPQITIEMMRQFDWYLEKKYTRKITSRRLNKYVACNNSKGGTIDTESILVFVPKHPLYSIPPM